ncbi:hypothetical protein BY996DRAFT_6423355 [Phakopsora pachyrhizi]|uniref:Expressed protein n=1 Tax=Phakopsora pachyrhizi TaxID=170000 RepID=A0AAV0BER1_PHAPC|nr:hypothetical protein BY996DRAFT_6423355 [Phakopsora pachyrhizi]CAH7684489.1 expressed protein [Phakopsora pachyrhizi]
MEANNNLEEEKQNKHQSEPIKTLTEVEARYSKRSETEKAIDTSTTTTNQGSSSGSRAEGVNNGTEEKDEKRIDKSDDEGQKESTKGVEQDQPLKKPDSENVNQPRILQNQTQNPHNNQDQLNLNEFSDEVRQLSSMFPQIGPSIIEAVLVAHNNDGSACVSDLLAMSDPSYKPAQQEAVAQTDEELARQLDLQERQMGQMAQQATQSQQQQQQFQVPYQPRIKKGGTQTRQRYGDSGQQPDSEHQINNNNEDHAGKDELQKITDELSKLAETGKKTVSTWLNKAKAKMQEIQQQGQNQTASSSSTTPAEQFDSYEHIEPPLKKELNTNISTNTNRSTRISPTLPYASRYESPGDQSADTSKNNLKYDNLGRKSNTGLIVGGAGAGVVAGSVIGGVVNKSSNDHKKENEKASESDDESLEYTRNPFEDDD